MTPWIAVAALYFIGLVGLHATARDLNEGSILTKRAWASLLLWPIVIPIAKIADFYEQIWDN